MKYLAKVLCVPGLKQVSHKIHMTWPKPSLVLTRKEEVCVGGKVWGGGVGVEGTFKCMRG